MRMVLSLLLLFVFASFADAGIFKRVKERRAGVGNCSQQSSSFQQSSFQQQSFSQQRVAAPAAVPCQQCPAPTAVTPQMPKLALPK